MGGSAEYTENTVRYAPYLEGHHQVLLDTYQDFMESQLWDTENRADPYAEYTELDMEAAFFGSGYVISSYPSLYDMYGKFMAGLDVEVLFDQVFEDTINGTVVSEAISQEAERLSDQIDEEAAPRLETGLRDINSIVSSSFIIARSNMETERLRTLSKYSADLKVKLIPVVAERWTRHLAWNSDVVKTYAEIMKFYITQKMDTDNHNLEVSVKSTMWPYTVLEQYRLAVGTLTGAQNIREGVQGASKAQKVVGGAMSGAAVGSTWGPVGAGIGAGIGGLLGLF